MPWIRYGGDFGANAWQPAGGLAAPGRAGDARDALSALADSGATTVRWFVLCDGRAGIRFDDTGGAAGLDDCVFADLDVALDLLARAGLSAIFVLIDFLWFSRSRTVNGVRLGGRGKLIADAQRCASLLDRVLAPILERYGHESAIRAWDLINEPDWIVTRIRPLRRRAIAGATLREFVRAGATRVHELTVHAATVGSARPSTLQLLLGLGLDFYQVHWYDKLRCRFDLTAQAGGLGVDRPVVLGEFPTRGCRLAPAAIFDLARASGYAGALAWSARAADRHSDAVALRSAIERHLHQC
ncbi:MAG: hypothetical protein ACM3NQ_20510 [Bacteroidales bacterium]